MPEESQLQPMQEHKLFPHTKLFPRTPSTEGSVAQRVSITELFSVVSYFSLPFTILVFSKKEDQASVGFSLLRLADWFFALKGRIPLCSPTTTRAALFIFLISLTFLFSFLLSWITQRHRNRFINRTTATCTEASSRNRAYYQPV